MISKEEVKHIAKLARLGLTEKEIEKFQKELSSILDYFEKLKEVDTSKTDPTTHSVLLESIIRKDETKEMDIEIRNKLIELSPDKKERFVKVKSIL